MDLKDVMQQQVFAVVGNTIVEEKYACKIKNELIEHGYIAYGISKELKSINDIEEDVDVIDLCINPVKGLEYLKECKKPYKCVVIQPGAEGEELFAYLREQGFEYMEGCLLVGMRLYSKTQA